MADNPDDKKGGLKVLREALERAEKQGPLTPNQPRTPITLSRGRGRAEIENSQINNKVPWYESSPFWGIFSLGAGLLLSAVGTMKHDVRFLLWLAAPCFIYSAWILAKNWLAGVRLWVGVAVASVLIVSGLAWMYVWLRPLVEEKAAIVAPQGDQQTPEPPKKQEAPKKSVPKKQSSPPPVSQDCGGGNCAVSVGQQGGITAGQVNIGPPPAQVKWRIKSNLFGVVELEISVDRSLPGAIFVATCDKPCVSVSAAELGGVFTDWSVGVGGHGNEAALRIVQPEILLPNIPISWSIKSADSQSFTVQSVRIVRLP